MEFKFNQILLLALLHIMQMQVRHVQKRGNSYYFRLRIPDDLRIHFHGRREITKTLQTMDAHAVILKASELFHYWKHQFEMLRSGEAETVEISIDGNAKTNVGQKVSDTPLLSEILAEMNSAKSTKFKTELTRKSAIRILTDWHGDLPI